MLGSGCLHVIVYISTSALESRNSMTTSAIARIIDYHFMLGIINRIIFGSRSPIIKIIEQRPHRQEEEEAAAANIHNRRPVFY